MSTMRDFMKLVELVEKPRENTNHVPPILYYGISTAAWNGLKNGDPIVSKFPDKPLISFMTDWNAAAEQARQAAAIHGDTGGIVVALSGENLARDYDIVSSVPGMDHASNEWHIAAQKIINTNRYITGAETAT